MELVFNFIVEHFDDPHAVSVGSDLTPDGRGDDQLEVLVEPSACIPVVMAAKDLADARVGKLVQHFDPESFLDVEVELFLLRMRDEPGNVLKDYLMLATRLPQLIIQPLLLGQGQIRYLKHTIIHLKSGWWARVGV